LFSTKLSGQSRPTRLIAFTCALLLAPLALVGTGPVAASGSSGGFSGSTGGRAAPPPKVVDEVYEYGKSIYLGRAPGTKKVNYCVNVDGAAKKLRGRTVRDFKGASQIDFANALVNCQQPDQLALTGVKKEEIAYVLYYLNKRYRLNLSDA